MNEETNNLAGLGDLLPAEVLKMINELLEQQQQKGHPNNGSKIEFVYVASGGQHVETQVIASPCPPPIATPHSAPLGQRKGGGNTKEREPRLPDVLATEEAVEIWKKVQEAGYVGAHYQPLLSRTQSALLANAIAERLGIREKWKTFEMLWNRKNIRSDYNLALRQHQSLDFQDELKRIL